MNEKQVSLSTVDSVHTLLHPTFQLAVRDEIIRKNPSDGVMAEISRNSGKNRGIRHALTIEQRFRTKQRQIRVYAWAFRGEKSSINSGLTDSECRG